MKVRLIEHESYVLSPEATIIDYHSGPIGEIDEATLGRWMQAEAAWKGFQAELTATYHAWCARKFAEQGD